MIQSAASIYMEIILLNRRRFWNKMVCRKVSIGFITKICSKSKFQHFIWDISSLRFERFDYFQAWKFQIAKSLLLLWVGFARDRNHAFWRNPSIQHHRYLCFFLSMFELSRFLLHSTYSTKSRYLGRPISAEIKVLIDPKSTLYAWNSSRWIVCLSIGCPSLEKVFIHFRLVGVTVKTDLLLLRLTRFDETFDEPFNE